MSTGIDFSTLAFSDEQVRSVKELTMDNVLQAPELSKIMTIFTDIVINKEIGFIGESGLIGRASDGCHPTADQWNIQTRKVKWEPKEWSSRLEMCYKDLISNAAVYSLKYGIDKPDFTDSDYMNIIRTKLEEALKMFYIRLFWFNDTVAKNVKDGGQITDGADLIYFNLIDGIFKQLDAIVAAQPARHIAIAENAGASEAEQIIPKEKIQKYMYDLVHEAPITLRGDSAGIILMTQTMYDSYYDSLSGTAIESMYTNLTTGNKALTYKGIPVIAVPVWDKIITQYQNKGKDEKGKNLGVVNPNRAIYTTVSNLGAGVDTEDQFSDFNIWYEKKDRTVMVDMMGNADAKILNSDYLQFAI